jgi:hypothetical protein
MTSLLITSTDSLKTYMAMLQVGGCLGGRFQCLHSLYRILRDSEKNAKTKKDLEKDGIRM